MKKNTPRRKRLLRTSHGGGTLASNAKITIVAHIVSHTNTTNSHLNLGAHGFASVLLLSHNEIFTTTNEI
jgi:hypothetical protein